MGLMKQYFPDRYNKVDQKHKVDRLCFLISVSDCTKSSRLFHLVTIMQNLIDLNLCAQKLYRWPREDLLPGLYHMLANLY